MARNKRFGALLSEGIVSVAKRQRKNVAAVERAIAEELGYTHHTVQRWRRGYVPKEPEQVAFLVRYCVTHGRVDQEWAQSMLKQARYPEQEALLRELFPLRPGRAAIPHLSHNLPTRWGDFLGRGPDLEAVLEALHSPWPVILIEGMGGVGKTTLALEVAYGCVGQPRGAARDFAWPRFDYIVWTSAAERDLAFQELLDTLAHRLDYPGLAQRPLAEKQERLRDVLAQQPVLLIVDNFETVTDHAIADFLVRVPPATKVLLTGREGERLLPPIFRRYPPARIRLGGLPDTEALTFLRQEARRLAGLRRETQRAERARLEAVVQADDRTLLPLVKATEGNPKALALALGYIADHALSLPVLVHDLYAATDTVAGLFDYLFAQAWERCGDEARALWRVIPFFAAPARREALKAASGLEGRYFQDALEALQARSLVEAVEGQDDEPRYRAHPLVRAFGQNRLNAAPDFEQEARERWVRFYIDFVERHEVDDRDDPSPFRKVDSEWSNILAVSRWLYHVRDGERFTKLFEKVRWFLHIYGYWEQRVALAKCALELAESTADEKQICWLKSDLGWTLGLQDRFKEAFDYLDSALEFAQQSQDIELLHSVYSALTLLGERSQEIKLVETYLPLWQEVISAMDDWQRRRRSVEITYRQATIEYNQGNSDAAEELFSRMVRLAHEVKWERAIAYGLNYLGELAIHRGDLQTARQLLDEGWQLIQRWQDKRRIAYFHRSFALLGEAEGNLKRALDHACQAHDLFHRLGMRREEVETARLIQRLEEALARQHGAQSRRAM